MAEHLTTLGSAVSDRKDRRFHGGCFGDLPGLQHVRPPVEVDQVGLQCFNFFTVSLCTRAIGRDRIIRMLIVCLMGSRTAREQKH